MSPVDGFLRLIAPFAEKVDRRSGWDSLPPWLE